MNLRLLLKLIGAINLVLGCLMVVPALYCLLDGGRGLAALATAIGICLPFSALLYLLNYRVQGELSHRDGFTVVGLGWLSASLSGSLPFLFSDGIISLSDALFESISGFTTTGATILPKVSALPDGVLLWRSMIQWLGGMGIVLLSMAVLPLLGIGGARLYRAEVPGPTVERLTPRIKETARLLWWVYLLLTVAATAGLWLAGMGLFDAVNHALTAMATGGFSTRDAGIMHFASPAIELVLTVVMLAAGCNFALHLAALTGRPRAYLADEELRGYLLLYGAIAVAVWLLLWQSGVEGPGLASFRHALFQTASIMTTTGFNSTDFELWRHTAPATAFLLLVAMFLGGMSGSTGGGVKIARVLLSLKRVGWAFTRLIHPRAVTTIRLSGHAVPEPVVAAVEAFLVLYLAIFLVSTAAVTATGVELVTAFSAVAACQNNIGPGFGVVGPTSHYGGLPLLAKWVLMFDMLVGRLELYTILLLFVPGFWRRG